MTFGHPVIVIHPKRLSQNLPVAVAFAIFADKDAFLLKADGDPFYRGDGLTDDFLKVLLRDVGILPNCFDDRQFFKRTIQSIKLRL